MKENMNMPPTPILDAPEIDPEDIFAEVVGREGKLRACDLVAELMDSEDHRRRGQFSAALSRAFDTLIAENRIHFRVDNGNKYWVAGPDPDTDSEAG